MSYYGDEFYYEPSDFEMQIEDFKQSLLKCVKDEFVSEMDRLKTENAELQIIKKDWKNIQDEYQNKHRQLENEKSNLKREVRRERLNDLMKDFHIIVYRAESDRKELPKCDKCNEKRKVVFLSPTGKQMEESCKCSEGKLIYVPVEMECASFGINRDGNKFDVWYQRKYEDSESYSSTQYAEYVYKEGAPFEAIKNRWSTFFVDKEQCQSYCNWLMEQEKQKAHNIKASSKSK